MYRCKIKACILLSYAVILVNTPAFAAGDFEVVLKSDKLNPTHYLGNAFHHFPRCGDTRVEVAGVRNETDFPILLAYGNNPKTAVRVKPHGMVFDFDGKNPNFLWEAWWIPESGEKLPSILISVHWVC